MAKRSKYGEETIFLSVRVPKSKKDEISDRFYSILGEYVVGGIKSISEAVTVEKKSNPTDVPLKVPADKFGAEQTDVVGIGKLATIVKPKKVTANVREAKYETIASLPFGTELVEGFGSKGAIRKDFNDIYYTKRTYEGKLEILKHESKDSAFIYAEQNFK